MGQRQKEWAKRARAALVQELGGCCVDCGSTRKLEFDCEIPQGDKHHKMDTSARICFYRKQHSNGNVRLRCKTDHRIKTSRDRALVAAIHKLSVAPDATITISHQTPTATNPTTPTL